MQDKGFYPHMKSDKFAELIGIRVDKNENGEAVLSLEIKEHHLNGVDTAQGGCIFTLADYAFALASNSDRRISVALNLSTHFINPARLGDVLTTWVREISRRRVISIYEITVLNQDEKVIATFTATAYKIGEAES